MGAAGAAVAAITAWPLVLDRAGTYDLGTTAAIAVLLAVGFQVPFGATGQVSLAHAPVQGAGAYVSALLMVYAGQSFWAALVAAMAVAAALGMIIAAPAAGVAAYTARARWWPFRSGAAAGVTVTLAVGVALVAVYRSAPFTGGSAGIAGVPLIELSGTPVDARRQYLVAAALALAGLAAARGTGALLAARSAHGHGPAAARDDGWALVAAGAGAALAGAAGALHATQAGFVSASPFGLRQTLTVVVVAVAAGAGRVTRTALVAVTVTALADRYVGGDSFSFPVVIAALAAAGGARFAAERVSMRMSQRPDGNVAARR
ncbi:MAG: ABC transporter permease subunit [Acidimicrobiia bacterium]